MAAAILFISLAVFIFLNIPISISLGLSSALTLMATGSPLGVIPSMMQATVQKFSLLTIPLFVLAGVLMDKGGISKRLINLADSMMGPIHGGLGYVAVISALFFAAISGSGTATVAAMGSILIPAMVKQGYDKGFSSALSAISGSLGTVIPPSITFIIYGMITGESISDLFLSGIVPGIIFAAMLCLTVFIYSKKNGWKGDKPKATRQEIMKIFWGTLPGFLSPVIVLGGIYSGFFTPTEAAAVAVIYSFIVGKFVYKELTFGALRETLFSTAKTTGIILLIIMNAGIFSWILTQQGIATQLTELAIGFTTNKYVMLLIINVVFLMAGCVMDNTSALYIIVPIILPIARALDINLVHLGVILVLNLSIGQVTPPVGPNLYVAADIGKVKFEVICRKMVPLLIMSLVALLIITFVPWLTTCLI
ncbi:MULTISPECIES: TRAP transporter large permease [Fusobacterium]|jgi:C4-dicarboxylate transporter DctM subunit|uniref:Neu5Ac permease n=2 Tax=Fusobacterium ulcerans TaxID=861 RepID=A0AAX1TQ04_9FUSO|nr:MULTISPECIES: TRAP transporter large permease [Fusobacterium]AVQ27335.1 TRAP transporter large permease [Fusobacterium ulcerans]EFS24533.1 TRAP transporter, DctM subunit [Fusobacterium ulcerans ATCC 49185]EHO82260.1 TRAP transporter, DctM subunit [Fusobacterium ulcerans 12-1B]MDH6458593.1 C4-dicarboxylate transporter DctM subunit [Fusobacterium sp. PH5-7]MEE0139744.1 TRAP transporter large permease [Fusobacterium ulcerans]